MSENIDSGIQAGSGLEAWLLIAVRLGSGGGSVSFTYTCTNCEAGGVIHLDTPQTTNVPTVSDQASGTIKVPLQGGRQELRFKFESRNSDARLTMQHIRLSGVAEGGADACTPCPAGSHQDASFQCVTCAPGTFSASASSTVCAACPKGSYSSRGGATACTRCGAATTTKSAGSTKCSYDCTAIQATGSGLLSGQSNSFNVSYFNSLLRYGDFNLPAKMRVVEKDAKGYMEVMGSEAYIEASLCGPLPSCQSAGGAPPTTAESSSYKPVSYACLHIPTPSIADGTMGQRVVALAHAPSFLLAQGAETTGFAANHTGLAATAVSLGDAESAGLFQCSDSTKKYATGFRFACATSEAEASYFIFDKVACAFTAVWKSMHACPRCAESDVIRVEGQCHDSEREVRYRLAEPAYPCMWGERYAALDTVSKEKCSMEGWSTFAIVAAVAGPLLFLTPVMIWLCWKWMAYNALRAQYDVLKGQVPTGDFSESDTTLEMDDEDVNAIQTPRGLGLDSLDGDADDVSFAGEDSLGV